MKSCRLWKSWEIWSFHKVTHAFRTSTQNKELVQCICLISCREICCTSPQYPSPRFAARSAYLPTLVTRRQIFFEQQSPNTCNLAQFQSFLKWRTRFQKLKQSIKFVCSRVSPETRIKFKPIICHKLGPQQWILSHLNYFWLCVCGRFLISSSFFFQIFWKYSFASLDNFRKFLATCWRLEYCSNCKDSVVIKWDIYWLDIL